MLDYKELKHLVKTDEPQDQDRSFLVNAQRKINGMTEEELKNGY